MFIATLRYLLNDSVCTLSPPYRLLIVWKAAALNVRVHIRMKVSSCCDSANVYQVYSGKYSQLEHLPHAEAIGFRNRLLGSCAFEH